MSPRVNKPLSPRLNTAASTELKKPSPRGTDNKLKPSAVFRGHGATIAAKPKLSPRRGVKFAEEKKEENKAGGDDFKNSLAALIGRPRPMKKTPAVAVQRDKVKIDSLFDDDNLKVR